MKQKFDIKRLVDSHGLTIGYAIVDSSGKRVEMVESYNQAIVWIDAQPEVKHEV